MSANIAARIPEELDRDLNYLAKEKHTDKSTIIKNLLAKAMKNEKLNYALERYSEQEISLGRAAELSGINISDFMEIAAAKKIPINYTKDDVQRDFEAVFGK